MTSQDASEPDDQPKWWHKVPWGTSKNAGSNSPPQTSRSTQVTSAPLPPTEKGAQIASRPSDSGRDGKGRNRTGRNKEALSTQPVLEEADSYWFGSQEVSREVALALRAIGYEEPTAIQTDCIAPLLAGDDVVGQAHTGTGKTAAFGIPLVERTDPSQTFIQGLVLVPTRELAMQVRDEITRLGQFRKLGVVACYGGQPIARQLAALRRKAHIVVGTPGRVLDHIGRGTLQLADIRTLVLDEADEMLDIGFLPDIERILRQTPSDRQTTLFSATLPPVIRGIVARHMRSPIWIRIGNEIETAPDVRQVYYEVLEQDRVRACCRLLETIVDGGKVLVFRRTKAGVDNLTQALQREGIAAKGIHGGMVQSERNAAMQSFRVGEIKVLIATNVAARGLDIPHITHVINYDMPQNQEEYVHRIGRTARMGRDGTAITFVSEWDFELLDTLQENLEGDLTLETLQL